MNINEYKEKEAKDNTQEALFLIVKMKMNQ